MIREADLNGDGRVDYKGKIRPPFCYPFSFQYILYILKLCTCIIYEIFSVSFRIQSNPEFPMKHRQLTHI